MRSFLKLFSRKPARSKKCGSSRPSSVSALECLEPRQVLTTIPGGISYDAPPPLFSQVTQEGPGIPIPIGLVSDLSQLFFGHPNPDNTSLILEARASLANADADARKAFEDLTGADFRKAGQQFAQLTGTRVLETQLNAAGSPAIDTTISASDRQVIHGKLEAFRDTSTRRATLAEFDAAMNRAGDLASEAVSLREQSADKALESEVKLRQANDQFRLSQSLNDKLQRLETKLDRAIENRAKKSAINDLRDQMRDVTRQRNAARDLGRELRKGSFAAQAEADKLLTAANAVQQEVFVAAKPFIGLMAITENPHLLPIMEIPGQAVLSRINGIVGNQIKLTQTLFENFSHDPGRGVTRFLKNAGNISTILNGVEVIQNLHNIRVAIVNGDRAAFIVQSTKLTEKITVAIVTHGAASGASTIVTTASSGAAAGLAPTTYFLTATTVEPIAEGLFKDHLKAYVETILGDVWDHYSSTR